MMASENEFSTPNFPRDSLSSSEEKIHEEVLAKFASLLSTSNTGSRDIVQCLSPVVSNNDVVCTLPSLDMQSADVASSPLPEVGQHREKLASVPEMKASIFDKVKADTSSAASQKQEEESVKLLEALTSWTRSSLVYASDATSKSISSSFQSLVDARIRAWTVLLLKHSLTTGDTASRERLLGMLSFKIQLKSSKISFNTLPLPESARGQPKDADVILPLLFQAELELIMQDRTDTISFQAPGTVSGDVSRDPATPGLTRVDIRLDCAALLESMVEQARLFVFRAVARATSNVVSPRKAMPAVPAPPMALPGSITGALAVSEEVAAETPQLQKARSSALRLSSILESKSGSSSAKASSAGEDTVGPLIHKTRKNLSVKWEVPADERTSKGSASSAKRQRVGSGKGKGGLRSIKSFGRPHAEDGMQERNATFGDFGRTPMAAGPVWGKDGRLKNHPVPGGGLEAANPLGIDESLELSQARNATFDLRRPARPPSAAIEALLNPDAARSKEAVAPGIPRTATALENWLVNATKAGAAKGLI